MHAGKRFTFLEFAVWTRRDVYKLLVLAVVPTVLFAVLDWKFLSISWVPIALLGTAVSLIVGFKNNAAYGRAWEARQIYGGIINTSRAFGVMVRDFLAATDPAAARTIFYRHFGWLTALRYQLREPRVWETQSSEQNAEYQHTYYRIPERETPLDEALRPFLAPDEQTFILARKNRATQLLARQSAQLNGLQRAGHLTEFQLSQIQAQLTALYDQQGRAERIKNFPYPRNFSSITTYLLYMFVALVPYGLLKEFATIGAGTDLDGRTIWLNIPFALVLTWVFVALDRVGDSSMNPFEGGANDVPITNISRIIEIDLREMLGETDLPPAITPVNQILL